MKRNLLLTIAGALAVGLIAAGCGSDSGNDDASSDTGTSASTTSSDTLTKAEFVTQGNAICKAGNAEIDAGAKTAFPGGQPTDAEADAFVTDTLVPSVQGQIDDLRALGIPEADADQVNGILDDAEGILDKAKADPSTMIQGEPFSDVNKQLSAYGLTECGK